MSLQIFIKKGETEKVNIVIPINRLRRWNRAQKKWKVLPGTYRIYVSPNSAAESFVEIKVG